MLTFAGVICALQHLQLCNSHQGAVWLWIYMYILKSVSQVRTPNAKCIAQEHWEDLSLPLKSGVESRESHRCNWNIFLFWRGQAVAMLLELGERKLLCFSHTCSCNFTRRKMPLKGNVLRSFYRKYLSFHPRQMNSAETNDVIVLYK